MRAARAGRGRAGRRGRVSAKCTHVAADQQGAGCLVFWGTPTGSDTTEVEGCSIHHMLY